MKGLTQAEMGERMGGVRTQGDDPHTTSIGGRGHKLAKEADNRFLNDLDVDMVSMVGGKRVWYQTYLGANSFLANMFLCF
mgnify:CR=1 FL=1